MRKLAIRLSRINKIIMSDTYVPLISSGVAGPLGVLHLPRLWQKVSLEENGKLASGYPGVGKGFDAMTPRRARSRRAGGKRLHQAEQADLSRIRGLGKEECQVAKTRRDREAQRGGARLQS